MSFPDHKRLDELKQQAALEALGMLSEAESAQLDRDFRDLPSSVQAELRRMQADMATDPAFLADEEPQPSLRARTVAAVMTEIEAHDSQLAPIAQIGAPVRRMSGRTPVRSIDANELMQQAMAAATAKADALRFARTSYWWRAAAIALAAALIVAIYFERQANLWGQRVGDVALQRESRQELLNMLKVRGLGDLAETADKVRGLRAVANDGAGSATVLVDSRTGDAMLLTMGLTKGQKYTLRVTREDGHKDVIATVVPNESLSAVALDTKAIPALLTGQIELVDSRGIVVLST